MDDLFLYVTSRRAYRSGTVNTPIFNTPCSTGGAPTTDNIGLANGNAAFGPVTCLDFGHQVAGVHSGHSVDLRPLQRVQPEYLTDVEVGVRSTWAYDTWRGRINAQYFHYKYSNVAESVFLGGLAGGAATVLTPNDPGAPLTGAVGYNGGTIVADGVESDFLVKPSDALSLDLNVSWLHQRPVEATVPPGFLASELPPFSVPTPKWALTYSMNYLLPWRLAGGELAVDYNYFYTGSFVAQQIVIPSYDLHSARLQWDNVKGAPISIDFFINNMFDKRYIVAAVSLGNGVANYGEPRMFGVDVKYRFH
jgi:iron complex outermembrane receptor protein